MLNFDEDEKREAMDLMLRVERTIGNKIDRGIEKQLITPDEAKKLEKALKQASKKHNIEWWLEEKVFKSFEIATHLLNEAEYGTYYEEIAILEKIEKA